MHLQLPRRRHYHLLLMASTALVFLPDAASAQPGVPPPPPVSGSDDEASLQSLGSIGGPERSSTGTAVSEDGSVVVGASHINSSFAIRAFRWTRSGGMANIGTLAGGSFSVATGVSGDGTIVVGDSNGSAGVTRAFRWTEATGMADLGVLGGFNIPVESAYSYATDISRDGNVIVGSSNNSQTYFDHAFRWTQAGGMVDLGTLGGSALYSAAWGVNADGSVVVGGSATSSGYTHAFRWTEAGGLVDIGTLMGGLGFSEAFGVTADGSVVVGTSSISTSRDHAFLWSAATGMIDLGALGGGSSIANDVSDDGRIVVGSSLLGETETAFRWTAATGMQDLNALLSQAGVAMSGIHLRFADAITGNGQFIVGSGNFGFTFDQAYIVRYIAPPGAAPLPPAAPAPTPPPGPGTGSLVGVALDQGFTTRGMDSAAQLVVGNIAFADRFGGEAAYWTQAGGLVRLGIIGGSADSRRSDANAVSADGSVIVGETTVDGSGAGSTSLHAFRWTQAGGMQSLGTLAGVDGISSAHDVSGDGSVIVGQSSISGGNPAVTGHAFRWTQVGGMLDLGTIGGIVGDSFAWAVSRDGTTVVGESDHAGGAGSRAFRWQAGTGMIDLGVLGELSPDEGYSVARDVNADGSVVVGESTTGIGFNTHAFRWTAGTGMVDLGSLAGSGRDTSSEATVVSDDGLIVFGNSDYQTQDADTPHAFRWTAETGMQDLNVLLSAAGVDMRSIQLYNVTGASGDGQFILAESGRGSYIVRYQPAAQTPTPTPTPPPPTPTPPPPTPTPPPPAPTPTPPPPAPTPTPPPPAPTPTPPPPAPTPTPPPPAPTPTPPPPAPTPTPPPPAPTPTPPPPTPTPTPPPIAGITTPESVIGSVAEIAGDGPAMVARQHRLASPLLSQGRRIIEGSYAGAYGHGISNGAGLFGRLTLGNVSIIGGAAYGEDQGGRAELGGAITLAAAVRYLPPARGPIRPFAEAGGWLAGGADLRIGRTYMNGAGTATGVGETQGGMSYYYVRLGAALPAGPAGELAASAEIGRSRLQIDGYVEPLSNANPFEATVDARHEEMTLLRLRAQYNVTLAGRLHLGFYGAHAWSWSDGSLVTASVPGIGAIGAFRDEDPGWFEFGARIGYDITPRFTVEAFANGDTGEEGVGQGIHAGIGLKLKL